MTCLRVLSCSGSADRWRTLQLADPSAATKAHFTAQTDNADALELDMTCWSSVDWGAKFKQALRGDATTRMGDSDECLLRRA
jgi:hypothetical protein